MVNSASKREQKMLAYYAEREQNRRSQSLRDKQLVYSSTKQSTCLLVYWLYIYNNVYANPYPPSSKQAASNQNHIEQEKAKLPQICHILYKNPPFYLI